MLLLILIVLIFLLSVFFGIMIWHLIVWSKDDYIWNKYNNAYNEWLESGCIGKMPTYEDFINKNK